MAKANRHLFKSSVELHTIHEHSEILAEKQKAHRRSLTCGKTTGHFTSPCRSESHSKSCFTPPASARLIEYSTDPESPSPPESSPPVFKLDALGPQSGFQELQVYSQVFEDIIKQDSTYGSLLAKVKAKYDEYIRGIHSVLCQCEQQRQVEVRSLSAECASLKQELENLLAAVDTSQDEEKQQQVETINRLSKELRIASIRESKHMELLKALKQAGAPVNEVYQKQFKKHRHSASLRLSMSPDCMGTSTVCSSVSPKIPSPFSASYLRKS